MNDQEEKRPAAEAESPTIILKKSTCDCTHAEKKSKTLFSALAKAQGEFKPIPKRVKGYGYKYAALDDHWEMLREPLSNNGLCILQEIISTEDGSAIRTTIATSLDRAGNQ